MMSSISKFMTGMLRMPTWVKLWLLALMTVNMVIPLFYFDHLEAQIVLITFLASFILQVILTGRFGFTRILGLGHVLWIPMVLYLISRIGLYAATDPYGLWMRSVIIMNSISLVIDCIDVVLYAKGDREEQVSFD